MQPTELNAQISKYKLRRSKLRLSLYNTCIASILGISIFSSGLNLQSLLTFLVILPVPLYFALQSHKFYLKVAKLKTHVQILSSSLASNSTRFSFLQFISQPNLAFRLTLFLFIFALFTSIAFTRQNNSVITYDNTPIITTSQNN